MIRRALTVTGWGVGGVAVAAALIAGAFAVAGTSLTEPATPIRVSAPPLVPESSATHDADVSGTDRSTATPAPTSVGAGDRQTGAATSSSPEPGPVGDSGGADRGTDARSGGDD